MENIQRIGRLTGNLIGKVASHIESGPFRFLAASSGIFDGKDPR